MKLEEVIEGKGKEEELPSAQMALCDLWCCL